MEKEFFDRVKDLADELLSTELPPEELIGTIKSLADKHRIQIKEKDLGVQKHPVEKRSWRKYQIWFDDPDSFEGGVYGQSEIGTEQAYLAIFKNFQLASSFRTAI